MRYATRHPGSYCDDWIFASGSAIFMVLSAPLADSPPSHMNTGAAAQLVRAVHH